MKKFIAAAVLAVMGATAVQAADLPMGAYEASGSVMFNLANGDQDETPMIYGTLGYYLQDNMELGAAVSFQKHEYESYWRVSDVWGISVFGEYNFNNGGMMVPYVGASLGFLDGNDQDDDTSFLGTVYGGLKFFVTQTAAVTAIVKGNFADEEIYDFDRDSDTSGDGSQASVSLGVGLTFLL